MHRLAEQIRIRELERLEANVRIGMLQVIVPLPLQSLFWQQAVEQKLDAFGWFVVCAGLTAASFFSAFWNGILFAFKFRTLRDPN